MKNLPKYIRININNKTYQPKFGDYVKVNANIIPTPKQIFIGTYDLEKEFYFKFKSLLSRQTTHMGVDYYGKGDAAQQIVQIILKEGES